MATTAYINGYQPFQFNDLSGGLNLRDKSDAVGDKEAIDLLNVDFTERGAVKQRDGYADFSVELQSPIDSLSPFYTANLRRQLVLGCADRLDVVDDSGGTVGGQPALSGGPYNFARFADPAHEYLYAANGKDTLQRWNGTTWLDGAGIATVNGVAGQAMPRAGAVCVTASVPGSSSGSNAANRLVATAFGTQTAGGPGGQATNPSRVYLSNPGQPELWETDGYVGDPGGAPPVPGRGRNWLDLTPGDGERITNAITWRELVFIFKETKFFVLWGEGTGSDGNPTFQVREVVNNIGLTAPWAVTAGRDGVYFVNRRGVYHTTGSDPTLLSDVLSPLWQQDSPDVFFSGQPINLAALEKIRALWHMERLYVAVPTGAATSNDRVLVYDTQHGWWTLYDLPAAALTTFRSGARSEVHFAYSTGPRRVGHLVLGSDTDRGQPIRSWWRSGWSDYGSPQQKTLRESKIWGTGALQVGFSVDLEWSQRGSTDLTFGVFGVWPPDVWNYQQLTGLGGTYTQQSAQFANYAMLAAADPVSGPSLGIQMTWQQWLDQYDGKWPTLSIANRLVRYATRGTLFSTQFASSPNASTWSVHRVSRHLRETREPSIR